jgi:citrate lyase subunit beta/citryl-CoA lyase
MSAATPSRPRLRSLLYAPGDRPERVEKALASSADLVLADLEDAVAPDRKAEARKHAAALLKPARARGLRGVRINAWPGAMAEADLEAILATRPDVIAVPKCEEVQAVRDLDSHLAGMERKAGLAKGTVRLLLILETAAGVLAAQALARASPRVLAVAFGAEDLAADAGLLRSPGNAEVSVPRALVALAAASAKVAALDMITADPRDGERAGREALEARSLGYAGKMCIHPAQLESVHAAFQPTAQEVAWARRVLAAVQDSGIADGGVAVVDGRMVDVPFIEQARRVLADAEPVMRSDKA